MLMICPVCKQLSTFRHYYDVVDQHVAPVLVSDGKPMVDYDNVKLNEVFEMDDEPDICMCDKCENDVEINRIKVVHEKSIKRGEAV